MTNHLQHLDDLPKRLVFVSLEPWDEVWRRNQFFCRELVELGWSIVFVEPANDWSSGLRRLDRSQFRPRTVWSPEGLPQVRVVRPMKVLPKAWAFGERVNRRFWLADVNRVLMELEWDRPALWMNNQLLWPIVSEVERGHWGRVLYDITDDWTTAGGTDSWLAQVRRDDAAMCALADEVVVCSESLAATRRERYGDKLHLVMNGVDIEHFASVDSAEASADTRVVEDAELRLGYSGTAHPDRLDVGLVESIAKARPKWSWLFVGPNHLSASDQRRLDLPNVRFLGPRAYADLPTYLAGVDVCVTPHKVTPFTESLNPIKLWEYLAVGHPIVSTPVAGFRDFSEDVSLASDASSWIEAIEAIAEQDEVSLDRAKNRRRERVSAHGWPARTKVIESILLGESAANREQR